MTKSNLAMALGLGAAIVAAGVGSASAAVVHHGTPVHARPSYSSHIVNYLERGEHVRLIDRQGGWCDVSIPGPNGWVRCSVLGNYPLSWFRPGITFSFGFPFPYGMMPHPHPMPHPPGPMPHPPGPFPGPLHNPPPHP